MHSLLEFLTAAPKSYVIKIHRRQDPDVGLMQAAKVIQLVYDWALNPSRIQSAMDAAERQGRYLLGLIYIADERGATEAELLSSLPGFPPSQVLMLLGKLEQELLIFSREADKTRVYQGFREMAQGLLPKILKEHSLPGSTEEAPNWISYRHFLASHLCHFLCQVKLGNIKITQSGEMHRKDQQELAQRFTFGEKLSSILPGEEIQLILHFVAAEQLVLQENGILHLSPDGLEMLMGDKDKAWHRFIRWWATSRVHGLLHTLNALAEISLSGLETRIAPWANLLWIHSGQQRKGYAEEKNAFTWENTPKVIQELWLFGLVEFGLTKGRIAWIRPLKEMLKLIPLVSATGAETGTETDAETTILATPIGEVPKNSPELETGVASSRPISLPNLESLVPIDSSLSKLYPLNLVGHKSNDEFMARFHFTKESVIQGLQAGLSMAEFKDLLDWLGFEAPAKRTLLDWASTYASTMFMDALILKVSDKERFSDLQEIPQFLELITDIIPNYGFVLSQANKIKVKELLQHFGLVPGEDSRKVLALERVILDPMGGTWELTFPNPGIIAYRENPGTLRAPPVIAQDKNSIASREQEMLQRIETLEEAIAQEKKVEFSYPSPMPKRISLRPLLLLKHRDPVKLIGIEMDSGHRNEYVLENIKALRIME